MKTHLPAYLLSCVNRSFYPNERSNNNITNSGQSPKSNLLVFLLVLTLMAIGQKGYSQTNTWNGGGGNLWNDNTRWSQGHYPTAAEDVVVPNNRTLNVNIVAVCKSLVINNGNNNNTVTITGTNSLTVTNGITINAPLALVTKTISVGTGTLSCASITMGNPLLAAVCSVTASTGTINVSGDIIMNGAAAENAVTFSGAGTLNLGGDMTGGSFTCATSTVNCNTASTQTMSGGYTFYNLRVNKAAAANTVDFSTPVIVNNDFTILIGTASLTGTTANYTVTNDLAISSTGTLINTVDYASTTRVLNVGGDWTNNGGTFTPGTGLVNFNTTVANQSMLGTSATQSFYNITINKTGRQFSIGGSTTTLDLAGTMTLSAGTLVAGTAANINMNGGNWTNNGGAFTAGTGTVNFTSITAAQNINGSGATQTFNNITVNKTGQQLNVAGSTTTVTLGGNMLLTAGTFNAGTATTINIAGNWTNDGATFTPASGTVVFNSTTAAQSINGTAATQSFNAITVAKTAQTLSVAGATTALSLSGTMTLTSGIFAAGTAASIDMTGGNWTNNGGTFTPGTGTVTFSSTTAGQNINGTATTQSFNSIVVNKTGQSLTGSGTTNTLNISGTMTLSAGTLVAGTITAINMTGGDWINNGATFTPGTGTVTFSNTTANQNITGTAATQIFNNITVNKTGQQLNVAGSTTTLNLNGTMLLSAGTFDAGTAAAINIAGNWTNNGATFTPGSGTVTFNSTAANQNINGTTATQSFNNIVVNKTGRLLNVAGSTTTLNLAGTMTLTAGTLVAGTALNINMTDGNWTNNGGAFTAGTGTVNFTSVSAPQNIQGTVATQTFNNIVINKMGQQLNVSGLTMTLTLSGSMTITAGTFAAGTATAINVAGNWTNDGTGFTAGSGTVTFNGSVAQVINGSVITTFNNISLNNSNGLSLSSVDVHISGAASALSFTNGKITTGSFKVTLGNTGTIAGAGAGKYVYGNLQLGVATGSPARVFEIGDAATYAPVSVTFNNVTVSGNITAYTTGTEHPNIVTSTIDESRDVNRYWTMSNSGTTLTNYTATFNFVAGDIDAGANTANFIVGRRTSSWAYPSLGAKNPTNITATLSSFGTYACGEGGAGVPTIATGPADQIGCSGGSVAFSASANNKPNSTVSWEVSTDGGVNFSTLIIASPYSVSTSSASAVTSSTLTINPTAYSMDGYTYRAVFTNTRGSATSFDGMITALQSPTADAGAALSPICNSGTSAPLGGSVGGSATGGTWSTPSGGTFTPNATTLNATWTPPVGFTGTATLTLTSSGGSCGTATASKTQVVSVNPAAVAISPASASICVNAIQALTVTGTTTTQSSGAISVGIPNNSATGVATSPLVIAGIPAGATINSVSVTFSVTHGEVQELMMNLRAPNGKVLNLANRPSGGTGTNFTNTVVSSNGTTTFASSSSPFTGTYAADATPAIGPSSQTSDVTTFSSLYSIPNGNWVLSARDNAFANSGGTITSWSISINWTEPITWSPITYLYTNAAATTAYTAGTVATTVYAKPTTGGTTTYTATSTNPGGCTSTQTVAVTAGPVVTITPDYCYGGGYIQLNASSTPAATTWLWNTGATTSSILINLAGNYQVTATVGGCSASVTSSIAQELVVNGDFTSGNTGFTSLYTYVTPGGGNMYPEATYTVNNNPNTDHSYFFGQDHTSGTGKMMIVNGSSALSTVWQETFTVQPNTTYYFSAWAVSVNDVPPYAQLQFDINGSGIGTTAVLPAGPNNTSTPSVWQQFYGSWTSGAGVTSATVSIKDLQTALGGNDFALDDISFGTLSTFVTLASAPGSDSQAVCINTPISSISYAVGAGATGPSVTGLPTGVSYSFNGTILTISGTPTVAGTYNYTVTNSSCNPITKYGQITVNSETLSLSSAAGTNAQAPCINTAITNITYTAGGGATGATVTGLPAGVTYSYSAPTLTISGTPTAGGVFNYTVTTTGGVGCIHATLNGSMNVKRQIITRTSAAGTNLQTVCINTAITNITYVIGGTATGAGVTGLPTGVSGSLAGNVFTISGTPTAVPGVYTYVITTTGTCVSVVANGSVTITGPTAILTSAVGTDAQGVCPGAAITTITYNIGGTATGANISGLPTGVAGSFNSGVYTISGTPSVTGAFTYTITTTGGTCGTTNVTGSINITTHTIGLTSAAGTNAQTLCISTAINNITYAVGGSATGASVSGLPAGVSGSYSAGVYTISGTPTASGTFNYIVSTSGGGCSPATANGSITVSPAAVGGTIADVAVCYADNGNLTLTGNVGTVSRWEISTDGTSWSNISNTTATQSFTGIIQTTWYRALVQSGACASTAYSNTAKVGIHNLWTGATSSDWNTVSNWSDGQAPTTSCPDVTIPVLTAPNVYPQLTSGTATINNLVIHPSATMIVSNATLQVAGTITNNGVLDITGGTLELNGAGAAQTIAGSMFSTHTIQNLVISNSNDVSFANTNDTMRITGVLSFGANNAILNTNNNLTLVSNAAGTASVGDLTNGGSLSGNNITGNATVERYIPLHPKAWQFLAVPTSGQSINNAWQEGNTTLTNNRPGYGTIITGHMSGAVALGFDIYTPAGPSMKTYNAVTNVWDGVASTTMQIADKRGYMFLVRGDRSVTTSSAPATATTLRTTGKLFTIGADAPASTTVLAGKMESIGNPYASAIDFRLINKPAAPAIDDAFYIWDPLLTNNYFGLGGYQTISAANGWKPIPGGTVNYDANVAYPYIQSGQAFFVHATGAGGAIAFSEANKVNQYSMANRINTPAAMANRQFLRTYLYNASSMLSDGNVVAFDSDFSNAYDANDASKASNSGENLAIVKGDKLLALEARSPVVSQDTIFYTFTNIRRANYQLRFNPDNMADGLTAKLVDKYLNTVTPISMTDTSSYNFTVNNDAGSWALDRFYVIFNQAAETVITAITANRNANAVPVNWTTQSEHGIAQYEIQRSVDGSNFNSISEALPTGNNGNTVSYNFIDPNPVRGTSYYRIKGDKNNGSFIYSAIVRLLPVKTQPVVLDGKNTNAEEAVANDNTTTAVNVFPNPVVNKTINLQFVNQEKGTYQLELINQLGETVYRKTLQLNDNIATEKLYLERAVAAGNYQLKIKSPGGTFIVKQVIIQ